MLKLSRRSLLLSSAALAAGAGLGVGRAFAQSDATATLKLQGFGGEAQLASINNAIKRFNAKYPNVTVEVEMDAISTGWGDYVTKVLGQFNAGAAADVYGTAIETFQAF
ncbi:MAG: extracellular solute-binding protein, partial [Rhizobiales bacterium]|nr:extracellular solute-binding protein [Hyphomicrobiales bacterium]